MCIVNYTLITKVLFAVYGLALLFLVTYGLIQINLVYNYLKSKRNKATNSIAKMTNYPTVTVQLPVYNERFVIERLIDAVANFDYPKNKLEIHVLDDSTDETKEIIDRKVSS